MSDNQIISSLKIGKLFGEYDIDIEFKKITVLVGKNGLGKTTLLKIIEALMTQKPFPYEKVTENIKLNFSDGNLIYYGDEEKQINEIKQNSITDITMSIMESGNLYKIIDKFLSDNKDKDMIDSEISAKKLYTHLLKKKI